MSTLQNQKALLLEAYNLGNPLVSDAEWDALYSSNDGLDALGTAGKVKLPSRMGSLKKFFLGEDNILDTSGYVKTIKLDGCAGGLLYVNGEFKLAATRGDGSKGTDVTMKARLLIDYESIPKFIDSTYNVWITGEFAAYKTVENSRNFVAGFLGTKTIEDARKKADQVYFIAYGIEYLDPKLSSYKYITDLTDLDILGFDTVNPQGCNTEFLLNFPTDGHVYRTMYNEAYYSSGYTGNYKNLAFAVKERSEGVVTELLDIIWQTGKSGKVTPVAILKPVIIGEATISRATLHNWNFIEELGLYPNCQVLVERSGEIIPRIIGLAND